MDSVFIPALFLQTHGVNGETGHILHVRRFLKWLNKSWSIRAMGDYEAIKENEVDL